MAEQFNFGPAKAQLSTDLSNKADKAGTVLTTTLSRGRNASYDVGTGSFAFGSSVVASGTFSHAEGTAAKATGSNSHAEGDSTVAAGTCSHAEGIQTSAYGGYSHAEGNNTNANHKSQHVFGEYNTVDSSTAAGTARGNYVEIVGNGTGSSAKSNARALDWDGNEYLKGDLYVGCNASSANGEKVAKESDIIKPISISLDDVTNTSGSYTHTTTVSTSGLVTEGMKPIGLEVSNPAAFKDKVTITVGNGTITLSCNSVEGTSQVDVTLMRVQQATSSGVEPTAVTSEEFDILASRIGQLNDLATTAKTSTVAAINEVKNQIGTFTFDISLISTLADLVEYIKARNTSEVFIVRVAADIAAALCDTTTSLGAVAIIMKASSANAYYSVFNRNVMAYGNISLSNGTVTIKHDVSNQIDNKIKYKEFTFKQAIPSGTVGERGAQQSTSISSYETDGYKATSVVITNIKKSSDYMPIVFLYGGNVYCNWYKSITGAVTEANSQVDVLVTFTKDTTSF